MPCMSIPEGVSSMFSVTDTKLMFASRSAAWSVGADDVGEVTPVGLIHIHPHGNTALLGQVIKDRSEVTPTLHLTGRRKMRLLVDGHRQVPVMSTVMTTCRNTTGTVSLGSLRRCLRAGSLGLT